jgi:predicted nuclease of predicted toxin-antitoxin system
VRFLIDENLSPRVAELLTKSGHDAVHVRDLDAKSAADLTIVDLATKDSRVIISGDTDFGAVLAHARATKPSVLLVREIMDLRPPELVNVILGSLDVLDSDLQAGAIAAFTTTGIRVRPLPLR